MFEEEQVARCSGAAGTFNLAVEAVQRRPPDQLGHDRGEHVGQHADQPFGECHTVAVGQRRRRNKGGWRWHVAAVTLQDATE